MPEKTDKQKLKEYDALSAWLDDEGVESFECGFALSLVERVDLYGESAYGAGLADAGLDDD